MASRAHPRVGGRSVRLTWRGTSMALVGVVLVVLAYVFVRTEVLYAGLLAMLLPVTAALYVWARRIRLRVSRGYASRSLIAGYRAVGAITISNLSSVTTPAARWREVLPWDPYSTLPVPLPPLRWRIEQATVSYTVVPPRRGVFDIGPLVVEHRDPFGLARSEIAVGDQQHIVVVPDVEIFPAGGLTVNADDGSAHPQRFRALSGDDDVTTRSYRRGDALRRVHWRASAHRGELMVREEEQHSHAEARIVLDTTRRGYRDLVVVREPHEVESEQFEWALRIAATLALNLEPTGFHVQFVETGSQQLATPSQHDEFLESCASIGLTASADSRSLARAPDPRTDSLLGVLFVIVADAEPTTVESLVLQLAQFELAIAVVVTADFDTVSRQFTEHGWRCIEAPPADSVVPLWRMIVEILESRDAR